MMLKICVNKVKIAESFSYFHYFCGAMNEENISIKIYNADTSSSLRLLITEDTIRAGFPSPAQDHIAESIDLNKDLIRHPASTFYGRVAGDSMIEEGIEEGDILVIDKSLMPEEGDLAVCCIDAEFTLKRIHRTSDGRLFLMPSNSNYRPIEVHEENEFIVWGIVTYTIKSNRKRRR